MNYTPWS